MATTKTSEGAGLLHDQHFPKPAAYSTYQRDIYASLRSPLFSVDPNKWESLAKAAVPSANFLYVGGNAGLGRTYKANLSAFDRYRLRPQMLVDATTRDISVELFGKRYNSPLLVAPIGVQGILHGEAEEATARACEAVGVPMILSTAATRTIEQIAQANGEADRWYQLYWPKPEHDDITISLLHRAQAAGYTALVLTADTFALGWRPADLDSSYLPFIWGQGCQIGFSDPVFNAKYEAKLAERRATMSLWSRVKFTFDILLRPRSLWGLLKVLYYGATMNKAMAWLDVMNSATYRTWVDLHILRENWKGPILLKGVQTVSDARRAAQAGLDGIIVSNHGGRQVDGAIASLDALAAITADSQVKASGITILFDSGIRTGSDILKALALGANAVLIGRPYAYGLAIAGQKGVEHVLKSLLADFDNTLGLIGKTSIKELGRGDLEIISEVNI